MEECEFVKDYTKWEEIYRCWKIYTSLNLSIVNSPIIVKDIFVPYTGGIGFFYGYDWIHKDDYEERINLVTVQNDIFMLFGSSLNMGTLHTLKMLAETEDKEEQAAIWLYTFTFEMLPKVNHENRKILKVINSASRYFLQNKFEIWHHAMRRLIPNVFFDEEIFDNATITSYAPIVEFAVANAALIIYEYIPVLYNSQSDFSKPDSDYSLRVDKRGENL